MNGTLTERVVLITGGAMGIGRALAQGCAEEGAAVVITDINEEKLRQTAAELSAAGLRCEAQLMDSTNQAQIEEVLAGVKKKYGRIDGMVNNAGIAGKTAFLETSNEEFDRIININLRSTFLCCRSVARIMVEQGSGSIVNMASIAGKTGGGLMGTSSYAASKGGVIAFSKGIARELAPYNVRVNVIAPGSIDTPMTLINRDPVSYENSLKKIPLHRRGKPEDLVGAAVLLLSDLGAFMVGTTIDVNGGSYMY